MLFAVVGAVLLLQLAAIYAPALRELLDTEPVAFTDLLIAAAISTAGYASASTVAPPEHHPDRAGR